MDNIQLREFDLAGMSGFQERPAMREEYNFTRRDISWIGTVEYNSPNGIAVIENVG